MQSFSRHCYNIRHQLGVCKRQRENLSVHEVWLHVDFAENWVSKSLYEVQAVHFGGSHSQLSLVLCTTVHLAIPEHSAVLATTQTMDLWQSGTI